MTLIIKKGESYNYMAISQYEKINVSDISSSLNEKQSLSNLTQTISSSSTENEYPSAKAVYTAIQSIPVYDGSIS